MISLLLDRSFKVLTFENYPNISVIIIPLANLGAGAGAHYGNNKRCVICYSCNRKTFYQYLILTVNCWLEINTNTQSQYSQGPSSTPLSLSLSLSMEGLSIFWNVCGGWTGAGTGAGHYINWTTGFTLLYKNTGITKLI